MDVSGTGGAFADVLGAARGGDDAAFAVLWRRLHPPLLRWLTVVAPGYVEDVASEVWISVVRGLSSFQGDESAFRGWVFTIARRRAIDSARRRGREVRVRALDGIDPVDPAASATPLDDLAARDAALEMLRQLTVDQAEVVALRVIAGFTVSESAAVVNKSEGAVRVLCHRGLRALAQQLDTQPAHQGATA